MSNTLPIALTRLSEYILTINSVWKYLTTPHLQCLTVPPVGMPRGAPPSCRLCVSGPTPPVSSSWTPPKNWPPATRVTWTLTCWCRWCTRPTRASTTPRCTCCVVTTRVASRGPGPSTSTRTSLSVGRADCSGHSVVVPSVHASATRGTTASKGIELFFFVVFLVYLSWLRPISNWQFTITPIVFFIERPIVAAIVE